MTYLKYLHIGVLARQLLSLHLTCNYFFPSRSCILKTNIEMKQVLNGKPFLMNLFWEGI